MPLLEQARDELLATGDHGRRRRRRTPRSPSSTGWPGTATRRSRASRVREPSSPTCLRRRRRLVSPRLAARLNMLAGRPRRGDPFRRRGDRDGAAARAAGDRGGRDEQRRPGRGGIQLEELTMLEQAIELAREANSAFETCRAMGNLASQYWVRGELARAAALWREAGRGGGAVRAAKRSPAGSAGYARRSPTSSETGTTRRNRRTRSSRKSRRALRTISPRSRT